MNYFFIVLSFVLKSGLEKIFLAFLSVFVGVFTFYFKFLKESEKVFGTFF